MNSLFKEPGCHLEKQLAMKNSHPSDWGSNWKNRGMLWMRKEKGGACCKHVNKWIQVGKRDTIVKASIAFHNKDDFISLLNQRFQLVNFQTQKITDYPNLPYPDLPIQNENNFEFKFCSASILHKKNNDISLVTHLQYENYLGSFAGSLSYKKFSFLVSYDLNQGIDGQWKIRGTWKVDDYPRLINFWQVRGSFYSLFSDGNFIHHQNLYDWKTLANFSHNFTRFVGNGAIYYA